MKATTERSALLSAVAAVLPAVASRSTIPAMLCVKLAAEDGTLTLTATNHDLTIRCRVAGVDVRRAGACLTPAAKLKELLSLADDGEVAVAGDTDGILLSVPGGSYVLPEFPIGQYPEPDTGDAEPAGTVPAGDLTRAVSRVSFAALKKEEADGRFALTAVLFEVNTDGRLMLAGADSRRLAGAVAGGGFDPAAAGQYLLPPAALAALAGALPDPGELVAVTLKPTYAAFRTDRIDLTTRLIAGLYPKPETYLGSVKPKVRLSLPVSPVLARLRQAAAVADEEAGRVELEVADNKFTAAVRRSKAGRAEFAEPLPGYAGPRLTFPCQPRFLIEFLKMAESGRVKEVELHYEKAGKPALLTCGDAYRYLLTPLAPLADATADTKEAA